MYNHIRCSHIIGLSTVFLSMLMIFGLFLGYLKMLSFQSALFALLVSVGVSVIINKFFGGSKLKIKSPKTTYSLAAIFVLLIFAGLLLFIMFPEMVFPVSCSDLLNHARTTRTIAKDTIFSAIPSNIPPTGIPLTYIHSYPLGLYGISAIFYEFFGNAYVILSLFTLFLLLLIGIVVYTISFQVTRNEKIAFLSLFLSLFSITTLWIFESGFIPQILGSFFLLVCVYCFIEKNKTLFLFACIGLFAYPPLLTVLILFLLFESIPKKLSWNLLKSRFCGNSHYFAMILFSAIIIFPESIGLFIQYIGSAKYLTGALLVRGGIYTPNPFGLVAFIPVLFFIWLFWKKKVFEKNERDKYKHIINLVIAAALMSIAVVVYFVLNYFITLNPVKQIQSLYQAVKFFYFLLIPLSILASIGFVNLYKCHKKPLVRVLLIGLLVFELIYFMGYSGVLLEKKSELSGYYSIVEKIDTLPAGIVVGVDSCVIDSNNYLVPFIYKSFIDNPDPSGPNICRLTETTRALQFWWADYNYNNGRFRIYDSFGKEVLLIGEEVNLNLPNIDYFLTACKMLADPIVFEEGKLKLYKVR